MRKLMPLCMLLLVLIGCSIFAQQANANTGLVKVVKSNTTIVYEKPSTSSTKLLTLSKNTPVVQLSNANGWAKISVGEKIGYTKISTLQVKKSTYRALKTRASLKSSKASNAKILVTVPKDAVVKNYGSVGNGLIFVQYDQYSGYILANTTKATTSAVAYTTFSDSMFSLPAGTGEFVTFVNKFKKVTVLSKGAKYSFVKVDSKYGYVESSILVDKLYYAKDYMPVCKNVTFENYTCKKLANGTVKVMVDNYSYLDYTLRANGTLDIESNGTLSLKFPLYKGANMQLYLGGYTVQGVVTKVGLTQKIRNKTYKNVIELSIYDLETSKLFSKYYFAPGYGLIFDN